MATTIKIKRGLKQDLPSLEIGELAYCTDTNELFIGRDDGNSGTENVLINVDLDEYITNASFDTNNGEVTLTKSDNSTVVVDLDGRYLQSFTETDPTVPAHVKAITSQKITNWDTAHGWGDHGDVGYLTSFTETDPVFLAQKGVANGVAELDGSGLVPSDQLPSYVDDVLEGYYNGSGDSLFYEEDTFDTAITGETGKIYIAIDTGDVYRWTGSTYVEISNPLDIASQAEAEAGSNDTKAMTPERTKQAINSNFSAGVIEENNNTEIYFWTGTQAEYDLLTPDANTIYLIEE